MTALDDALMQRMREIVLEEHRPFSFKDFERFNANGFTFHMKHGTFRNKSSKLRSEGRIELEYNSKIAFYTLPGYHFGNSVTDNHMGNTTVIGVTELLDFIESLPLQKRSIHDIHTKFIIPDIWEILYSNSRYRSIVNPKSKDIKLDPVVTETLKIQPTVHHTDTVSVVVGCSYSPISLEDPSGIIRLSNGLVRAEERISRVVDECGEKIDGGYEKIPIPEHNRWTVTLWHFGKDSKAEYSGKGFCITFGHVKDAIIRIYTKKGRNIKNYIRSEVQESPNKTIYEAIQEKINLDPTNKGTEVENPS